MFVLIIFYIFLQLYDLDGTEFTPMDTVRIYVETLEKFKDAHPDFIGSRMIYAPIRNTNPEGVSAYIETLKEIKVRLL